MTDDAPITSPRSWEGGAILRLMRMPKGGYEVMQWREGAWRPAKVAAGKVGMMPFATPEELKDFGVPPDELAKVER